MSKRDHGRPAPALYAECRRAKKKGKKGGIGGVCCSGMYAEMGERDSDLVSWNCAGEGIVATAEAENNER